MSEFGITSTGFNIKTFTDIETEMMAEFRSVIDPDINTQTGSFVNTLALPFIHQRSSIWEQMAQIASLSDPDALFSTQLDNLLSRARLERLVASPTRLWVAIEASTDSVISLTDELRGSGVPLFVKENTTLTNQWKEWYIKLNKLDIGDTEFFIPLSTGSISYNLDEVSPVDVAQTIIVNRIRVEDNLYVTTIGQDIIKIVAPDYNTVGISNNPRNVTIYRGVLFEAAEVGEQHVSIHSTSWATSAPSGVVSLENFESGLTGRDTESDTEALIRFKTSRATSGGGSLPSIIERVQSDVEGVSYVNGVESTPTHPLTGIPVGTIEIVVDGGESIDIAQTIWNFKSGGISTWGNQTQQIQDKRGNNQDIRFSRPVTVEGQMIIEVTYDDESIFSATGFDDIKILVRDEVNRIQNIGKDWYGQRFMGVIHSVQGVMSVDILLGIPSLGIATTKSNITIDHDTRIFITKEEITVRSK